MKVKMKDSGIEWIGEIPEDWKVGRIKDFYSIRTGGTPSVAVSNNFRSDKGLLWVKPDDLSGFIPIVKTNEYINDDIIDRIKIFPKDTLFICCIGTIGKIGYTNQNAYCNQQINGLNSDSVFMRFGMYAIVAQEKQHWYYSNGNVIKILNASNQGKIKIAIPSFSEQQQIAAYLDKKCALVERLIENQRRQIEKLKEYKQSVITETVTKGLDHSVPMKDSGIEWIGKIPEDWKVVYLSSICSEHKRKNTGLVCKNLLSLSYGEIKRKDINTTDGLLPESFESYNIIEKGDIVLRLTDLQNDQRSLRTGIAHETGLITSAYVTIRCLQNVACPYYIHYYLHSFDISKGFYGMGDGVRQGLNYAGIRKIMMLIPPMKTQQQIAAYLDKKCAEIDALIAIKQQKIDKLQEYKKSLIYEYVTGKKQVV